MLGRHGKSKDHRPDLRQVIVGIVFDAEGRPICSETWPGNATHVKSLLSVVDRLRQRFGIARMCVVADRGMISGETIAELEKRSIEYILGARADKEVRKIVLADAKPMVPLAIPRARDKETALEVKEVIVGDWGPTAKPRRYIVCFNSSATPLCGPPSIARRSSSGRATRNWSAMPATAASSPPCATAISRSTRPASPRAPASTASMSCAPMPSCPCSPSARPSRAVARGTDLPHRQGHPGDAAHLPPERCRHRRPPVLLVPTEY